MPDQKNESSKAPAQSSSTESQQAAREREAMAVGEPQSGDGGNAEVQENMDEINEKGYFGVKVDPTPNENYTLQGAGSGAPTPETDPEQAEKARAHAAEVRRTGAEPTGESKDK